MLPDSLIARASFTHGFPHYPNPNLPMALRPVVNRCANSPKRIPLQGAADKTYRGLDSFTLQSACSAIQPDGAGSSPPEMVTESIVTRLSGTPFRGSATGTAAIESITSVPSVTRPKIV